MPLPSAYLARCVNTPNEEALRLTYQYLMTAEVRARVRARVRVRVRVS